MIPCNKCSQHIGERLCIELGDWLCPECCGQYRIVDINCWKYCPFFFKEEIPVNAEKQKQ